jgi:hypothetical protein
MRAGIEDAAAIHSDKFLKLFSGKKMKQFEISRKAPTSDSSSPSVLVQPFRIET